MNFQNLLILNFCTMIQNFRDQSSKRASVFELQLERNDVKRFYPEKTQQWGFYYDWCCFLQSLWATGRILGGIKIWNNYHRYSIARQVDWALWNFD